MPLLGLRTVIYKVPDLARATAWYRQLTGAAPYFDEPFYFGFDVGGYELSLDVGEGIRVATLRDPFGNPVGLIENPHFSLPA